MLKSVYLENPTARTRGAHRPHRPEPKHHEISVRVSADVFEDSAFQKALQKMSKSGPVSVEVVSSTAQAPPAPPPAPPLGAPAVLLLPGVPYPVYVPVALATAMVMPPEGHTSTTPGLALIGLVPWVAVPAPGQPQQAPITVAVPIQYQAPPPPQTSTPAAPPQVPSDGGCDDRCHLGTWQKVGVGLMLGLSVAGGIAGIVGWSNSRPTPPPPTTVSCPTNPQPATQAAPAQTAAPVQTPAAPAAEVPAAPAPALVVARPAVKQQTAKRKVKRKTTRPAPARPAVKPVPAPVAVPDQPVAPPQVEVSPPQVEVSPPQVAVPDQPVALPQVEQPVALPQVEQPAARPQVGVPEQSAAQQVEEPGQKPISGALNRYIDLNGMNTRFKMPEEGPATGTAEEVQTGLKVGVGYTAGVTVLETVSALNTAHKALALGAEAKAMGAAAQAAAQAGQLRQAGQLAAQARATGAQAVQLGDQARASAATAGKLTIASGVIAVIDGGIDIYKGATTVDTVDELNRFARTEMQERIDAGTADLETFTDYANVHYKLKDAKDVARVRERVGAAKVAFGGTMIASPSTGPAAPIVGAVGGVGYLGTSVYQHVHNKYHKEPLPISVDRPAPSDEEEAAMAKAAKAAAKAAEAQTPEVKSPEAP